jgi:hypothetical protein
VSTFQPASGLAGAKRISTPVGKVPAERNLGTSSGGNHACRFFVVRATVTDPAKRAAFDKWCRDEHLPDAAKSWGVKKAWRAWGLSDPSLHQAIYQFDDEAALDRAMNGEDIKRLVADFNRDWPDVSRSRELLVLAQEFGT